MGLRALVLAGAWVAVGATGAFAVEPCAPAVIEVDTSLATSSGPTVTGEAIGQLFYAHDTVVTSLTVWRVPIQAASMIGLRAFILATGPSGTPDITRVLWEGPEKVIVSNDYVLPTPFTWTIDPPLVLPGKGGYAWFVLHSPCFGYVDVLVTDLDPYREGFLWATGRGSCSWPDGTGYPMGALDVVFRLEFCRDGVTSSARRTWGELKSLYR